MTPSSVMTPTAPDIRNLSSTDVRRPGPPDNDDKSIVSQMIEDAIIDIEHMPVHDDPREWSRLRKNFILAVICSGSMIAGFGASIQNPANEEMERDLPATSGEISWSLSLFILMQGITPLLWSSISEVKGRRFVYLISLLIFTVGSIVVATSKTIGLVIGMRGVQALGSSAVITIGAASLADIFDPVERGTKMGIYYISPLLGPSLGPVFGGILTTGFSWRAPFWFLTILAGTVFLCFLFFFKDTFRKERSFAYQAVLKRLLKERAENLRREKISQTKLVEQNDKNEIAENESPVATVDVEKQEPTLQTDTLALPVITLTLKDVAPIGTSWLVIRRWNNFILLLASGILFSYSFTVVYTTSRTLGNAYGYDALYTGLVLLSYGLGSMAGSILGGRYSDHELARLTRENGGRSSPEMRLNSTLHGLWLFPVSVVGFGWVLERHVHISGVCAMLFLSGCFAIYVFSSELAYLVDANVGRSSSAVAFNSLFRGIASFIAIEIAVPVQDALGDGWMYTIFGIIQVISGLLVLLVRVKGKKWRTQAEAREAQAAQKSAM
ncbi:vacuolar DHA amino acid exporter [Desarmillaria tabescens]|uniref:Vacuolar DHA amino acid exporter n=1 Tax=Armillaria tabescens TaxID=1929756 RepID=A0AA39JV86_ARMTA|nr:vacuolar DHA amino acid exporter [Desarmillaria tabescens]KAK0449557.1 vacuolar DHA amino acid exporter [Desarmillaria tabescens]